MAGGVFMFVAALCVFFVRDESERVPVGRVIRGDEHEPLISQQSAQPVPSTGLIDEK
jgi:hypothetical protein